MMLIIVYEFQYNLKQIEVYMLAVYIYAWLVYCTLFIIMHTIPTQNSCIRSNLFSSIIHVDFKAC